MKPSASQQGKLFQRGPSPSNKGSNKPPSRSRGDGSVLFSTELERLKAANSRHQNRGLTHVSTSKEDEKGDLEVLDLHKLILRRLDGASSAPAQPKTLAPISGAKGVAEALEIARMVHEESRQGVQSRTLSNIRTSNGGDPSLSASAISASFVSRIDEGPDMSGHTTIIPTLTEKAHQTYYDRVIAEAPDTEKITELLTTALAYQSDKFKSGSPMVDQCREELDRFLSLESVASGSKVPVSANARLATLFPNQNRQWAEVLVKAKADGHLNGVIIDGDGDNNEQEANGAGSGGFSSEVNKAIQGDIEDKVSSAAIERYVARRDIDPAFKRVEPHRMMHLQKNVFNLSEGELAAFADTTQLLQSKGEVQRLLQGVNQSSRQMELTEMRTWTDGVIHKNTLGRLFDEHLDKARAGPDGCIGLGQLRQCLAAAQIQPGPKAMKQFLGRVDPHATGRLRVAMIREAWADGELRLGLEPIEVPEARACLDLVVPAARQALGLHLTPHHLVQWMSRLGTSLDMEDAEAFIAKHNPLTCEKALDGDTFREIQGLWVRAKSKSTDTVSEIGLHQRLRDLEIGTSSWDIALDDLERHTSAMQSGFTALQSLQSEMDRQAKKVRLLAQLMPARYTRSVAMNTDISCPNDDDDDSDAEGPGKRGGYLPWNARRASNASSTTAPGTSPRGTSGPFGKEAARRMSMGMSGGGANAVMARDRLVEDLQSQVKSKNEDIVRVRVLFEGYKAKAESAIRSSNVQLKVKEAELQQLTEKLQSYELIDDAVDGATNANSAEERLQELQSHFLKKMRESESSHQEEIRNFVREIQTARNTFEEQKHALMAALNEEKDTSIKLMEKLQSLEHELNTRDEALNANESSSQSLAMNARLLQIQLEEATTEAKNSKDRAKMFEEQLALARKTQQQYVSREEMNRRIRETEANFQLKMGTEATSREKLQEELKITKDKLHAAGMNEIELKAAAEKRLNVFRIDQEKLSTHRRQLLGLVRQLVGQWFESVVNLRKGFATEVDYIADLFPWMSIATTTLLQTVTEATQTVSGFVTEIAQGAETSDELLSILREARKENGRAFTQPKDNIAAERDAMAEQLASTIKELTVSATTTRQVTHMLAVSKCAVGNLEDTLLAVTEALVAAAKGDDRAIKRYNLSGPGASEVSDDKMAEALKAFVPRRMPTSIDGALQAVGGVDGLKNKSQLPMPNSPPQSELKISFAAKIANKKAMAEKPPSATPSAVSSQTQAAVPLPGPILSYDPLMALQTQSQSLHSQQMNVFGALGQLAGRFTVLTSAIEKSVTHSASAAQAAAKANAALQRQFDKTKYLDESDDELDVLIKAKRAKGASGLPTVDEGHSASKAAASVEALWWCARFTVNAIAVNTVKPTLLKAKHLCQEINDKVSLKQLAETEQRLAKSREPYVKLLLKYLATHRGAQRRVKKASRAFTDAMFAGSDSTSPNASASATKGSSAAVKVPFEELKMRVVTAKEALDTLVLEASKEMLPHIDRFQTYLWQALQVGDRIVTKVQSAIEAATAAAADDASSAASKKHRSGAAASPLKGKGNPSGKGSPLPPHLPAKQGSPPNRPQTQPQKGPKGKDSQRQSVPGDKNKLLLSSTGDPHNEDGIGGIVSVTSNHSSPFGDVLSGAVSRTQSKGYDSFQAFALDGGQTYISEHTSGSSSSSSSDSDSYFGYNHDEEEDDDDALAMTGTISLGLSRRDERTDKRVREVGTQATLAMAGGRGNATGGPMKGKPKAITHRSVSDGLDGGGSSSQASKAGALKSTISQPRNLTSKGGKSSKEQPAVAQGSSKSTTPRLLNAGRSPAANGNGTSATSLVPTTSAASKGQGLLAPSRGGSAQSRSTQRLDTKQAKVDRSTRSLQQAAETPEKESEGKKVLKQRLESLELLVAELRSANRALEEDIKEAKSKAMSLAKSHPQSVSGQQLKPTRSHLSQVGKEVDKGSPGKAPMSPRGKDGSGTARADLMKSVSSTSSAATGRARGVIDSSPVQDALALGDPNELYARPADTNLTDVRFRENRVSSGSKTRPLPRPMSGNASNNARSQMPLHREESDPDLAVVRPSSATLNGNRLGPITVTSNQMQMPRYLRPSYDTIGTQTDLRDLANVSAAELSAALQPSTIPIGQRIRTWEETQAELRAQEAEAMRRLGNVMYSHVVGLKATKAQPLPSLHLEPPSSMALCGLKYKDIIVEEEDFEAKAPQSTVAMDVIFSSLPPECRIVAAKYCLLAMFGGPQCPLSASEEAFAHHLYSYHFAPHSHIQAPKSDRDLVALKSIHSDLIAIGGALLTGDFSGYHLRRDRSRGHSKGPSPIPVAATTEPDRWMSIETMEALPAQRTHNPTGIASILGGKSRRLSGRPEPSSSLIVNPLHSTSSADPLHVSTIKSDSPQRQRAQSALGYTPYRVQPLPTPSSMPRDSANVSLRLEVVPKVSPLDLNVSYPTGGPSRVLGLLSALPKPSTPSIPAGRSQSLAGMDSPSPLLAITDHDRPHHESPGSVGVHEPVVHSTAKVRGDRLRALSASKVTKASEAIDKALASNKKVSDSFPLTIGRMLKEGKGTPLRPVVANATLAGQ